MFPKVIDIYNYLDAIAPLSLAEKNDNNGLQIGSFSEEVQGILLSVDPSLAALNFASAQGLNLVITHHPLFYNPLRSVNRDTFPGKIIYFAVEKGLNLLSWHTPLDKVPWGVSAALAKALGWKSEEFILQEGNGYGLGRVVKFEKYVNLDSLAREIKEKLKTWVMLVGDPQKEINKLAICGGSCGFLKDYLRKENIFTLLTSDVKYHLAKEAEEEAFNFILIDHGVGESLLLQELKEKIEAYFKEHGLIIPVKVYTEKSPYKIID